MEPIKEDTAPYYKLGIFYFNPKDSRVFVPKRFGWGWTFNFAKVWTYLILIAFIALIIGLKTLPIFSR